MLEIFLEKNKNNLNKTISSTNRDIKLQADIEAEKIIKDIIKENSNFGILAEESGMSYENLIKIYGLLILLMEQLIILEAYLYVVFL